MKSSGGSSGHLGVYVGQDWWTFLGTYEDHTPILDISCGSMTVAISIADRKVTDPAVAFARELAAQAAKFAAEVERLYARHHGPDSEGLRSAGPVRRPDGGPGVMGGAAGTGIPAAPGLSPAGAW